MRSSLKLKEPAAGFTILLHPGSGVFGLAPEKRGREAANITRSDTRRSIHYGVWLMAVLLIAGVVYIMRRWSTSGFDFRQFLHSISAADWRWVLTAWALGLLSYYGRVLRWMVMLKPLAPNAKQGQVFRATAIGFSAVVLFGRPAEVVRPWLISRAAGVPFVSQMAAWFLERIYDTLIVLAVFGYSLAAVLHSSRPVGPTLQWVLLRGGWVTGITCSICLAVLVALQVYSDRLEQRILDALGFLKEHHQERAGKLVRAAVDGLRSTGSPRSILMLVAYSALEWVIIYLCYQALFLAFPETSSLSVIDVLAYIGFVAFGSIVQIPGVGGGFQLVSVLVLTELFHLGIEPAAGIALMTWGVTLVGIIPVGVLLALFEGLSWRKIIEIEEEAAS